MSEIDERFFNKKVQLATGVCRWSLLGVSGAFGLLQSTLSDRKTSHLVHGLRSVCLGKEIAQETWSELSNAGLLIRSDVEARKVPDQLKDVVLASVRGEGDALFLVSPFVDSLDRQLSDFLNIRDSFDTFLSKEESAAILSSKYPLTEDAVEVIGEHLKKSGNPWIEKAKKDKDNPPERSDGLTP